MKNYKSYSKKIISLLLSMVMILSAMPLTAITSSAASGESYLWPVPDSRFISSGYGMRNGVLHKGIDILNSKSGAIVATKSGVVKYAFTGCKNWNALSRGGCTCRAKGCPTSNFDLEHSPNYCNYGYGVGVVIDHLDGTYSGYGHMDYISVKKGQKVKQGDYLGKMGSRGLSSGTHLHFSISKGSWCEYNVNTNPSARNYIYSVGNYKVTAKSGASTNNSCPVTVSLDKNAAVTKWEYFLSTNKSAVSNINGTVNGNHKNTSNVDCKRPRDYTSTPKSQKSDKWTFTTFKGKALTPNTTYYYKATAYIYGKWYQSGVMSFKTANQKPGAPSIKMAKGSEMLGVGDTPTVLWSGASYADSYNLTVKNSSGSVVQSKTKLKGTTYVLGAIKEPGEYTVSISATNVAGTTNGNSASFTIKPNVNVTFYDTIAQTTIDKVSVAYGHGATAVKPPIHEGHTFSKWDRAFDKVTEDITVETVYDKNSYKVRFIDSFTNKVLKTDTVKYQESAEVFDATAPEGYNFAGWNKEVSSITADTDVYTVYKWADLEHPATVNITSIKRNTTKKGYDITVDIKNRIEEIQSGRLIVVLKSAEGVMLSTTESAAFALDSLENKTITQTVLYEAMASKVEVYVVNGYDTLGIISVPQSQNIDNSTSSEWSEWITYTGECPMKTGDGVVVETQVVSAATPDKQVYRYKIRETTTSYATSMSGYQRGSYTKTDKVTSTVRYVPSWYKGFDTNNALYKKYNVKPKTAVNNETQIVEINSTVDNGYIYWHWCRGTYTAGPIDRLVSSDKTSEYSKFHAFESTTKKSLESGRTTYKYSNANVCKDTFWWWGSTPGKAGVLTIKKQTYTTYKKKYNYYKISNYSDWIEYSGNVPVVKGGSAGTNKTYEVVETKTIPGVAENVYQYRYKTTSNPEILEPVVDEARKINISEKVSPNFAGKNATVWVYKYTQSSDFTNEYVGTTVVNEDGYININNVVLRDAPSVTSGDYTIVASIDGQNRAIQIGTIEAPKPEYTVTFLDYDGSIIGTPQKVTYGEKAIAPDVALLHIPEGRKFSGWSDSCVNVRSDMTIHPESESKVFTVAFVNWDVQTVSLHHYEYGSEITYAEEPESKDGYVAEWVIRNGDEYITLTEYIENGGVVTNDMVIETESKPIEYTITHIGIDDKKPANDIDDEIQIDEDAKIQSVTTGHKGDYIDFSDVQIEIEESEDYIFYGWLNVETGKYIDSTEINDDITLYPIFTFVNTTEAPVASIKTGEYEEAQTVELTCDTENSVIWYTLDGTDPKTSETAIEYTEPINITNSGILRFYAGAIASNDSEEVSEVYAINASGNTKYHIVSIYAKGLNEYFGGDPSVGLVKHNTRLSTELFESFEGYDFKALYYDYELTEEFYFESETVIESLPLYAVYEPKKYTVTFTDYDNSVISTQQITYLGSANIPESPVRDGYVFTGWNGDYSCITEDTVITAKYILAEEYVSIKLSRSRPLNISRGNSVDLKYTLSSDIGAGYEVLWKSDDPIVASVDENGKVTAVSPGQTQITVEIPYTGSSSSVTVNVTDSSDYSVVLVSGSSMKIDVNRYLRGLPLTENTVANVGKEFENENLSYINIQGETISENDLIGTGTIIRLMDGESVLDEVTAIMTGDFDGNGKIQTKDVSMISQHVLSLRDASEIQTIAVDANGDGTVNVRDCAMISRYLAGKESIK